MPVKIGTGYIDVDADFSGVNRSIAGLGRDRRWKQIGRRAGVGLAAGLGAGLAGSAVVVKKSIESAVDLGEEINKTRVVFRGSEKQILQWSKTTASSLGISRAQALEATGTFGNMLVPMGLARKEAGAMSKRMVGLAADMASFNNASPEETLDALRAGLAGETEPLRRFGVFLNEARIKQEAVNLGLSNGTDQLDAAAKAQATYSLILKDTGDAQGDFSRTSDGLANVQRKLRAQLDNMSAGIGRAFVPAAEKGARVASELLGELEKIANREDLDLGEKLKLSAAEAQDVLAPIAEQAGEALRDANIDEKIADAFSFAAPKIARAFAEAAPHAALSFVDAWRNSDALAKLAIGGFLYAKLGGARRFQGIGAQAGGAMGAGMAQGTADATVAALPGRLGAMKGRLKAIGKTALGAALFVGVTSAFDEGDFGPGVRGLRNRIQHAFSQLTFGAINDPLQKVQENTERRMREMQESLRQAEPTIAGVRRNFARLDRDGSTSMRDLRRTTEANMELIRQSLDEDSAGGRRAMAASFDRAVKAIRRSMREGKVTTEEGMREIRRQARVHSDGSRESIARNFDRARGAIERAMNRSGKVTEQGLFQIRKLVIDSLRIYGVTSEEGLNSIPKLKPLDQLRRRRGGPINVGKPSGDSVPALLERGEYVLNREAVRRVGLGALDRINFQLAPRFQRGGYAGGGQVSGDTDYLPALHRALLAMSRAVNQSIFVQSGRRTIAEQQALYNRFKGVRPVAAPSPNAPHVRGVAADITPGRERFGNVANRFGLAFTVPSEAWHIELAGGRTGGARGGGPLTAERLARIVVGGADSPLRTIVQKGLDRVREAAQGHFDAAAGSGSAPGGGATENMRLGREMMLRFWGPDQWPALRELWQRESGWSHTARNPSSGAFGIPQALPPGKMGDAAVGGDAGAQIAWGLRYIRERYGSPSAALAFHDQHNWYRRGGLVGLQDGGSIMRAIDSARGALGGTLRDLRTGTPKVRHRALKGLLDRVKAAGLPEQLQTDLGRLAKDSEVFGDFAQRAASLTTETPEGEIVLGQAGGLTEQGWLGKQLEALFAWRNRLIEAERIVVKQREQITDLMERAKRHLNRLTRLRRSTARTRVRLGARLERERDKRKPNRAAIRALRERIGNLDALQRVRERTATTIRERILPAFTEQRETLNTTRGDLLSNLESVQGVGSPMDVMKTLPGLGVFGGQLLDVQIRLRDLAAPPKVTDSGAGSAVDGTDTDSQRADLLAELLREQQQRTRISEEQFKVLRDFPPYGGAFAGGGVVPGPTGAARMILAHGGETVVPPGEPGAVAVEVRLTGGLEMFEKFVDVRVERVTRRQSHVRGLPGRGGGLLNG